MLQTPPSCPQCSSRTTRWLPGTSDAAFVDYFRCDDCGAVWVVGSTADSTREVTEPRTRRPRSGVMFLFVDVEAGLLFASMAKETADPDKRRQLRHKAQRAVDAVSRFMLRVELSSDERSRLMVGLNTLKHEIDTIPP